MANAPNGNSIEITLYTRDKLQLDSSQLANRAQPVVQQLINFLAAGNAGGLAFDAIQIDPDTAPAATAFGTLLLSGGAGSVGVIANGVSLTAAFATSDANTMNLVIAAINASANALISGVLQAGAQRSATLTVAAPVVGDQVTVSGITLTAVSGTANFRQFDVSSGNNTTIAANIAAALLVDPVIGLFYTGESAAAVVTVRPRYSTTVAPNPIGQESIGSSNGARLAVTAFAAPATASCALTAGQPGAIGNSVSIIATGTGASLGIFASPTAAYAAGNKLLQGGAGCNSIAFGLTGATAYYGRFA